MLYSLSTFGLNAAVPCESVVSDWYEGTCPQTGAILKLPRTHFAEKVAQQLMHQLSQDESFSAEGKMYGVLLVETPAGEKGVLKAFSGLLKGRSHVDGWVPPIPGRERVIFEEAATLAKLEAIKQELMALETLPERSQLLTLQKSFESQLQALAVEHTHRKQERQQQRQLCSTTLTGMELTAVLAQLEAQSQQDGMQRRRLKRQRDETLRPLKDAISSADARMRELKQRRKHLSQSLQAQMHKSYWLTNFAGESIALQDLMTSGSLPTGTGDCCAPKLLHYAATHDLKPLAMAEFWWGPPSAKGDKQPGHFYEACAERCQPIMGFLLSGLSGHSTAQLSSLDIPILYEDEWIIAVDKPAGLLSVPGRYHDRQDSVQSRLRCRFPNASEIRAVHRLDQETSGILLLARNALTYRDLSQQFEQRQVFKSYEAILGGVLAAQEGMIELPLWADPSDRPRQKVDWTKGKPSVTQFRVLAPENDFTRVEFTPLTGRTHQLRVHAADPSGLNCSILGDRLYGCQKNAQRLHLHAKELKFYHPQTGELIHLQASVPF